jgi:hypothetical protein
VIHLKRVILPAGLRAVAYRDARGNLVIYVSETLNAACQRAAIMEAVRAARRTRWRAGLPSAGIAILLGIRLMAGRALGALKLRPLAWGATATTAMLGATAAGVFVTAVPHHHAPSAAGRQAVPSSVRPTGPGRQPGQAGHQGAVRPVSASRTSPASAHAASTGKPRPAKSSGGASAAPSPTATPSPAGPSPSPSPSSLLCVVVLGVRTCV